ncbi:two-component system, OmpR family, sensor histidine kinase BaeS [Pseudoalteromonas ulvae UL12]|uniref:histidine kinase n=1 Tax=Pseudoalteromonas ulvae TaxID=107327 RepID=A0A244CU58_PSEDV|nr:ATP-binding protein [Pseudoalteromonas ulvae]MBE0365963.1 two-component system, OmpR family, sensor histidine kinase BaeS [Pseudoalteromonas ulvae UL12]OUL58769.1 hypothetical protein B1199_00320 [Pseudoalteromonas ulvae]
MRITNLIIFICVFFSTFIWGKTTLLDDIDLSNSAALPQLMQLAEGANGKNKAAIQLKIAKYHWLNGNYPSAIKILDALITSDNAHTVVLSWFERSLLEKNRTNYSQAEQIMLSHILPLLNEEAALFSLSEQANFYRMTGVYQRNLAKLPQAEHHYNLALALYIQAENNDGLAKIYNNLGVLYETQRKLDLAIEYQLKAMSLLNQGDNLAEIASNAFNLGELYRQTNDSERAQALFQQALAIDIKRNNHADIAFDYRSLASLEIEKKQYQQALKYNNLALDNLKKIDAKRAIARTYLQSERIYEKLNDSSAQKTALDQAEHFALLAGEKLTLRYIHNSFVHYYLSQDLLSLALERAYLALEISTAIESDLLLQDDHRSLANVLKLQQHFEAAYTHLEKANEYRQKLNQQSSIEQREKNKKDINLLQEQLKVKELEQTEQYQLKLIAKTQADKMKVIALFIIVSLLLIMALFVVLQRKKVAALQSKYNEKLLKHKDQLLADISHELRTPLTSLKLQVDALQYNLISDVQTSYRHISQKVMDINRLICDIYELAQSESSDLHLTMHQHHVATLLNAWLNEFAEYVQGHGFEWQQDIRLEDQHCVWDQAKIKQVLLNLIANSCLYTDKPGSINLSAYCKKQHLIISVNDTSPGVEKEHWQKIFKRLYRVEKSRSRQLGGSGLGLAICKNLVEAHQGTIRATDSPLGGLKVSIKLPIAS